MNVCCAECRRKNKELIPFQQQDNYHGPSKFLLVPLGQEYTWRKQKQIIYMEALRHHIMASGVRDSSKRVGTSKFKNKGVGMGGE